MNGKHHFKFSLYTALITFFLLWHYKHYTLIPLERCGFWFFMVVLYLNPDADIKSKPSDNLGIFKYMFLPLKHHGISHNPLAWGCLGLIFGYFGLVPEAIGLFTAAMSHIGMDWISTIYERIMPNWIKNGIEKVF